MKPLFLLAMLWLSLLPLHAQDFDTHWMAPPSVDSLSHYYFRKTYLFDGRPHWASVTLNTSGYVKVYVNACNVGTARYYPVREIGDSRPRRFTLDVTPYLRKDTNVVAVLFSPVSPNSYNRRMLSVSFYGEDADGNPFCHSSDSDWLCREAPSGWLPSGGEWMDARLYDPDWNTTETSLAQWTGVVSVSTVPDARVQQSMSGSARSRHSEIVNDNATFSQALWSSYSVDGGWHLQSQYGKRYFDIVGDSVDYEFGDGFFGQVRLTLREAHRGEVVHYGPHQYICSGDLDEQACPQFSLETYRRIRVYSDVRSPRDIVVDIEALTFVP
ncbi:MAG: alpha-L-rhamnosidase N-terminal domain-containing protein [Prevotella sp.]|jgi:hypothetical protein